MTIVWIISEWEWVIRNLIDRGWTERIVSKDQELIQKGGSSKLSHLVYYKSIPLRMAFLLSIPFYIFNQVTLKADSCDGIPFL